MPEAAAAVVEVAVMLVEAGSLVTKHQMVKTVKQEILIIPPNLVTLLIMIISQATLVQMVKLAKRDKLDKMVTQEMLLQ